MGPLATCRDTPPAIKTYIQNGVILPGKAASVKRGSSERYRIRKGFVPVKETIYTNYTKGRFHKAIRTCKGNPPDNGLP